MARHEHALPRRERSRRGRRGSTRRAAAAPRSRGRARRCAAAATAPRSPSGARAIGSSNSSSLRHGMSTSLASDTAARGRTICSTSATSVGDGRTRIWEETSARTRRRVGAGRQLDLERHAAVAAVPREDLAERLEQSPRSAGTVTRMATSRASRSRTAVERRDLGREDPRASRRRARACRGRAPACPFSMRRAAALVRLGEHDDLDAAVRVLEREDRHPVALPRLQLPARGDDAADGGVGLDRLAARRAPSSSPRGALAAASARSAVVRAPNSFSSAA